MTDLLNTLSPRQALAIAVGLSIVLYALAANLARLTAKPRAGRVGRFLAWTGKSWLPRAAGEVGRWLYYLGLPYATLMLGYNTPRALGVWNLDWLDPLVYAILLALGAIVVFIWVWRPYARTEHPHAVDESRWNWARHIIELIYQQAHWAFYRSGPILWLGDFYWGSFLGLGLVLLESWSNPQARASIHDTTRADAPLWSGSLAVASTIIFIFTQNFWYALAIHFLLDLGLRSVIGFPRIAPEDGTIPYLETSADLKE
ncbi:MAG: hypothetical protein HY782_10090 [Chloroflexi bacterium]|nr:hypothetical protein [Chloroflexota bacterium]